MHASSRAGLKCIHIKNINIPNQTFFSLHSLVAHMSSMQQKHCTTTLEEKCMFFSVVDWTAPLCSQLKFESVTTRSSHNHSAIFFCRNLLCQNFPCCIITDIEIYLERMSHLLTFFVCWNNGPQNIHRLVCFLTLASEKKCSFVQLSFCYSKSRLQLIAHRNSHIDI